MITGHVTSSLEATVRMNIEDGTGQTQAMDLIIDTGFSSFISLPPGMIASLGLPWLFDRDVRLADGRIVKVDVFAAVVIWDGRPRKVDVQALGVDRLMGMSMIASHDLNIRVIDGGSVHIDRVP